MTAKSHKIPFIWYDFKSKIIVNTYLQRIFLMVELNSAFCWYPDLIVEFFGVDRAVASFPSRASQKQQTTTHAHSEVVAFYVRPCARAFHVLRKACSRSARAAPAMI